MRFALAAVIVAACMAAAPVLAQNRPATCPRDLFQNEAGLRQQQTRLTAAATADQPTQCRAFREHVAFLQNSRAVFATCQSGREREENVALMDASLADYRVLLADRCAKR